MEPHPENLILVAGDYMVDRYLYGDVTRISPEAPVPVVKVKRVEHRVGGAGNVALNVAALGSRARALTCIGQDEAGDCLLEDLRMTGVDVGSVMRDGSRATSIKTRVVARNQQLLRYDEEQIGWQSEDFLSHIRAYEAEIYAGVSGVILSDYGKGVLSDEVAHLIIEGARKRGIPIFVDPKGTDYGKYAGANVCTPNLKELIEVSGGRPLESEEEIQRAAFALCAQAGIEQILVTRSERGMSLIDGKTGDKQDFPAVVKTVSDVTGAGDTVISTVAVLTVAGWPLDACCRMANIAASVVVSKFGAETASVEEINEALRNDRHRGERKSKICTREEIAAWAESLRAAGKRIVFTNGCFDLVHAGHVASLRKARSLGDVLIVGLNSDESVRRIKGPTRPVVPLENRARLLEALEMVDYIVPFGENTPLELIMAIRPDVLVKGKDWEGKPIREAGFVEGYGGRVVFAELEQGLSTTAIVKKILAGGAQ